MTFFYIASVPGSTWLANASQSSEVGPASSTSILGQSRDMQLTALTPSATTSLISADVGSGTLSVSDTSLQNAKLAVTWDGQGSPGLGPGGVDLTGGGINDTLHLGLTSTSVGSVNALLEIWDTNNNLMSQQLALTAVGDYYFDFGNFVNTNPAYFSSLDRIRLTLTSATNGWDAGFSLLEATTLNPPQETTPVPATLALLGIGLFGIGAVRRKTRQG